MISISEAMRILGYSRANVLLLAKRQGWPLERLRGPRGFRVSRAAVLAYKEQYRPHKGLPADPQTAEEWQFVVDAAHVMLLIDSARQYGLVAGGPKVNVERCMELLRYGALRGYRPSPTAVEDYFKEMEV
jgi:hypothetical protein